MVYIIKKGFTLIELLAVIVVLSIILLIVAPIIINTIEDARKGAFKNTAYGIIKTAELEIINNVLVGKNTGIIFTYNDSIESSYPEGYKLNYKGTKPQSGKVTINNKGKIGLSIYNGRWCAVKNFDEVEVTVQDFGEEECLQSVPLATIELIGNEVEYVEINTNYVDEGVLAYTIDRDIIPTIDIKIKYNDIEVDNIDVSKLGTYEITYITEYGGYKAKKNRTVIVRDTIPPVLTIPSNIILKVEEVSDYNFMSGVSVIDNSLEEIIVNASGNLSTLPGEYEIVYSAKDSSGNEIQKVRYVTVIDVGYPVITILGNNPANINVGNGYVEFGATAYDEVDGDITSKIITSGVVDVNKVGSYKITYTVSDNAGNETIFTRTVNIIDNVPPIISFGMNGNSTYAKSRSTTVIVSDAHSAVNLGSLKYLWNTSTTTPSESSFNSSFTNEGVIVSPNGVSGKYYLWIRALDTAGNIKITRTDAFYLDNTAPTLTIPGNIVIYSNEVDSFNLMTGVSASDNSGQTPSITYTGNILKTPGNHEITYKATDLSGNVTSKTRVITVKSENTQIITTTNVISGGGWITNETMVVKDGNIYLANSRTANGMTETVVWKKMTGISDVKAVSITSVITDTGWITTEALAVKEDGSVYLASVRTANGMTETVVWKKMTGISDVKVVSITSVITDTGWITTEALAVKEDGSVYLVSVRTANGMTETVEWKRMTGISGVKSVSITSVITTAGWITTEAMAIKEDGSVYSVSVRTANGMTETVVWKKMTGISAVKKVSVTSVITSSGWITTEALAVKEDGSVYLASAQTSEGIPETVIWKKITALTTVKSISITSIISDRGTITTEALALKQDGTIYLAMSQNASGLPEASIWKKTTNIPI